GGLHLAFTFAAIATVIAIIASALRGKRYLHATEPLTQELAEGAAESAALVGISEDVVTERAVTEQAVTEQAVSEQVVAEQVVAEQVVAEQVPANGTLATTEHLGADGQAGNGVGGEVGTARGRTLSS